MKSINNFIGLALLSGALLTSCSDSFLQRDSLTESSSNTFWQTPDDALMALASCYDALQSNQLYNSDQYSLGPLYMDCISDNGGHFNWSGWMEGYDMAMGIHTPSSSIIGSYWKDCYEVISRCNVLIANIDRVDMDASQKAIYQAEAKTIRALMYINLTMTYQDVPFLTAPLTIDEAECEKTDRAAIVAHVMTDLQDAAEVLPQNASSRGHITKGAALSLLGRVALYNEKWDDAIAAYKQVQGLGYSLDPSYAKLFTQSGETSPEIIFAVRYEGPGMSEGAAFNAHWNTPLEAMNGTIDLADAYYCKDGKPTTDTKIAELNGGGGLDVSKPNPAHFENRDPRLYSTLFVPGMLWNGKGGIDTSASNPYANVYGGAAASLSTVYVYKYFDPTDTSNSWDNGQDFYVVRYAEVLLSLAEAMVQKGGYVYSDVTALVNEKLPPVIGLGDCFLDRIFVCFHCNSNFRWHSVLFDRKFQFVVKWRIPAHRLLYGDHIVLFGHLVLFGAFVDEFRPKMSPHIAVCRTLVFVQDTADCRVIVLAEPRQQIQNVSTFGVVHNVATQVFDSVQYH